MHDCFAIDSTAHIYMSMSIYNRLRCLYSTHAYHITCRRAVFPCCAEYQRTHRALQTAKQAKEMACLYQLQFRAYKTLQHAMQLVSPQNF